MAHTPPARVQAAAGSAERLARLVNDDPTVENWAPRAPAVFAAAQAGSARAAGVIEAVCERELLDVGYVVSRPSLSVTLARATSRTGGQFTLRAAGAVREMALTSVTSRTSC